MSNIITQNCGSLFEFFSNHVKRADTVQPSIFLLKFLTCFLATCRKWRVFQKFLLTRYGFYGSLLQQFNITYLLRVPARLLKEPEQVFNFLSLHNEPEPRPSRKGWSGSGCCVAIFYCQISTAPWKPHDRLHGIPGDDPARESRKTPPEGGRKSMQGGRRTQYQLVKMAS